jgi:hypothetical protein
LILLKFLLGGLAWREPWSPRRLSLSTIWKL